MYGINSIFKLKHSDLIWKQINLKEIWPILQHADNYVNVCVTWQIDKLLEVTGAGSVYGIDRTLYQACEPVVQTACKDKCKKGDAM